MAKPKITNIETKHVLTIDLGDGNIIRGEHKVLQDAVDTIKKAREAAAKLGIAPEKADDLIRQAIKVLGVGSADDLMESEQARVDGEKASKPELPGIGHNGSDADARLRSFIERIERLETEKAELAEDIKEVYGEAKANGYDPKIMRKVVRMRKMDVEKRREEESLIEVYKNAVGMD